MPSLYRDGMRAHTKPASLLMPNALLAERMTTDECLDEVTEPFPSRLMAYFGYLWPRQGSTMTAVGDVI